MYSARHFCPVLTKSGIVRRSLAEAPNVKFDENRPVDAAMIRADRRDEATRRFPLFVRTHLKRN